MVPGEEALGALQHRSSGAGRPAGGLLGLGSILPFGCEMQAAAKRLMQRCGCCPPLQSTSSAARTVTLSGSDSPLPYSQLVPMNLPWGSRVADPGRVGCVYTIYQRAVPGNAVDAGIHSAKPPNGYNGPQHASTWAKVHPWT